MEEFQAPHMQDRSPDQISYRSVYDTFFKNKKEPIESLDVASSILEKLIARTVCSKHILDMFEQSGQFASTVITDICSEIIGKSNIWQYDYETQIGTASDINEEPEGPGLDVNAAFHLKVKKQTYISKLSNEREISPNAVVQYQTFRSGPKSYLTMNSKAQPKIVKHLSERGEDILPKPLIDYRQKEEDYVILNYRKMKEKQEKVKQEDKVKKEALDQKLKELDAKNKREDEKAGQKRQITYDSKGDIIVIKSFKADILPNPLLNPPYRIKAQRLPLSGDQSQVDMEEFRVKYDELGRRKPKPLLLNQIDVPLTIKEVQPMGSVFNEVEPSQGCSITENGKQKFGAFNASKKGEGKMTLEEYKSQKEHFINLDSARQQESLRKTQQSFMTIEEDYNQKQTVVPKFQLPLAMVSANPNQTMTGGSLFASKNLDSSRHYQSQTLLGVSGRLSTDRMLNKKFNAADEIFDQKNQIKRVDFSMGQSSYIDSLKKPLLLGGLNTVLQQDSKAISARNSSVNLPDRSVQISNNFANTSLLTDRDQIEKLRNKNRQIMTDHNWGQNNMNMPAKRIEKKPPHLSQDLRKSSSQLLFTTKRKERPFIEAIKEKTHLPPPPLGKSTGHGISLLPQINHQQYLQKFL